MFLALSLVSLAIFGITFCVHKHTFYRNSYYDEWEHVPLKLWYIISAIILSCIPVVNIIVFIFGAACYLSSCNGDYLMFDYKHTKLNNIFSFLNKDLW